MKIAGRVLAVILLLAAPLAAADEIYAPASPKKPWPLTFPAGSLPPAEEPSWFKRSLLWLPNRVLDLADVLRLDAGIGPAYGGVLRISRYGQIGYRRMAPGSLRLGALGRRLPIMLERDDEDGLGPWYRPSPQREVCRLELGAGLDAGLAGGYAGLCFDALPDFLGGLFFCDPDDDDVR